MRQRALYGTTEEKGFTLIELMVVVALIALLAAIVGPAVGSQINQAKQAAAIRQINTFGLACTQWARNNGGNPVPTVDIDLSNYATSMTAAEVQAVLGPDRNDPMKNVYIASVPANDPWGNPYTFNYNPDDNGNPTNEQVFVIRSAGSDGVFEGTTYTRGEFDASNFKNDIVWADGHLLGD
ncbi:MAG: prepilin-type N-terminal cleavage/methylation domain-containing protein [Acidobacteriota bacterium]